MKNLLFIYLILTAMSVCMACTKRWHRPLKPERFSEKRSSSRYMPNPGILLNPVCLVDNSINRKKSLHTAAKTQVSPLWLTNDSVLKNAPEDSNMILDPQCIPKAIHKDFVNQTADASSSPSKNR